MCMISEELATEAISQLKSDGYNVTTEHLEEY